jgi:hypothetical protein
MSKAAELANLIGNINAGGGGVNRNVIINGAMNVAQRGTSSTGLGASDGYFTVDRYKLFFGGSTAGRLTMTQDSSAPEGFANSMKLDCTTADTSIAAGEFLLLRQSIEGQNLQAFAKGTSSAKPFAVSFYVKGNANATYVCELEDADNTRQISKTFNVTTDWTRVELSFPADTTGTFDDDNAASLHLHIWLHAGSTYNSGTLNSSAFASNTNANRAVGISSFFDSTDRTFFITGVQLEVGQNPTSFEVEPVERTLAKCKRYFHTYGGQNAFEHLPFLGQGNSSSINFNHELPVEMRATPSLTQSGGWKVNDGYLGSYFDLSSVALDNLSTKLVRGSATTSSAIGGDLGRILAYNDINARWSYSAEL